MSTARSAFFYLLGAFGLFVGFVLSAYDGYVEDTGTGRNETAAEPLFFLVVSTALLVFARRDRRSSDGKRETAIAWGLSVVLTVGLAIGADQEYGADGPSGPDATTVAESYGQRHARKGEALARWGCSPAGDDDGDKRYSCQVIYRPLRDVRLRGVRFSLVRDGDNFQVAHVRPGIRTGFNTRGLTD